MADFAVAAATLYRRGGGLHGRCNSMPLSCTRLGVDLADLACPRTYRETSRGACPRTYRETGTDSQINFCAISPLGVRRRCRRRRPAVAIEGAVEVQAAGVDVEVVAGVVGDGVLTPLYAASSVTAFPA
jgi:hypothetical protein